MSIQSAGSSAADAALPFFPDAQGSTRALTNAAGTVEAEFFYDAFGELQTAAGDLASEQNLLTDYLYTGQQYDADLDLYSLRARYYDTAQGRFLSRDTYPYQYDNPFELNRYVYTANNPTTYVDPSGYVAAFEYDESHRPAKATTASSKIVRFPGGWHTKNPGSVALLVTLPIMVPLIDFLGRLIEELLFPRPAPPEGNPPTSPSNPPEDGSPDPTSPIEPGIDTGQDPAPDPGAQPDPAPDGDDGDDDDKYTVAILGPGSNHLEINSILNHHKIQYPDLRCVLVEDGPSFFRNLVDIYANECQVVSFDATVEGGVDASYSIRPRGEMIAKRLIVDFNINNLDWGGMFYAAVMEQDGPDMLYGQHRLDFLMTKPNKLTTEQDIISGNNLVGIPFPHDSVNPSDYGDKYQEMKGVK